MPEPYTRTLATLFEHNTSSDWDKVRHVIEEVCHAADHDSHAHRR